MGHSQCDDFVCKCVEDWSGDACQFRACPSSAAGVECSGHGRCEKGGACLCEKGWAGASCSNDECPNNCNNRGSCEDKGSGKKCFCEVRSPRLRCTVSVRRSALSLPPPPSHTRAQPGYDGAGCDKCLGETFCSGHGSCYDSHLDSPMGQFQQDCFCDAGYSGASCSLFRCPSAVKGKACSGHGECENAGAEGAEDWACDCEAGFRGMDCNVKTCKDCDASHGMCVTDAKGVSTCECISGWAGPSCREKKCPTASDGVVCGGNGVCVEGTCYCKDGFLPPDCLKITCPSDCAGHGVCSSGVCGCDPGWGGAACRDPTCYPPDCSGHGKCDKEDGVARCLCTKGWGGSGCGQEADPVQEAEKAAAEERERLLKEEAEAATEKRRDELKAELAKQATEFEKTEAARREAKRIADLKAAGLCQFDCHEHGACVNGTCVCNLEGGWAGEFCEEQVCPNRCGGHGKCDKDSGECECEAGFGGMSCETVVCSPPDCSGRGYCLNATCMCQPGFSGRGCEQRACLNQCSANGVCVDGVCDCLNGFVGEDCSLKPCPRGGPNNEVCSAHGVCKDGKCTCIGRFKVFDEPIWTGIACEVHACPGTASGHPCSDAGKCIGGVCQCYRHRGGEACELKLCDEECYKNDGTCETNDSEMRETEAAGVTYNVGKCVCPHGQWGYNCEFKNATVPVGGKECKKDGNDCNEGEGRGLCIDGMCFCHQDWTGAHCNERSPAAGGKSCPNDCSGRGECLTGGLCSCVAPALGRDCSCTEACGENRVCDSGKCVCAEGFSGESCDQRVSTSSANVGKDARFAQVSLRRGRAAASAAAAAAARPPLQSAAAILADQSR